MSGLTICGYLWTAFFVLWVMWFRQVTGAIVPRLRFQLLVPPLSSSRFESRRLVLDCAVPMSPAID